MSRYVQHVSRKETPQTEQARDDQVKNSAGGFVFQLDDFDRLERFLILGSEGGSYYASERKLTKENATCVERCIQINPEKTIDTIVDVSVNGRAPKNDPAIFALALAASSSNTKARKLALAALPKVCRIGTHMFQFVDAVNQLRGWGKALRRAVANWYKSKDSDKLAYQLVKYQSREKWSHRDVLRLAGGAIGEVSDGQAAALRWAVVGPQYGEREVSRKLRNGQIVTKTYPAIPESSVPRLISGYEILKKEQDPKIVARLVREYGFTHEMVPTESKNSPVVWEALLEDMPITAMIRNLGKMTEVGILGPMSAGQKKVVETLGNRDILKKGRVHPIAVLMAQKVYGSGRGIRGGLSWKPNRAIVDALDDAFYLSFDAVEPTGKNTLLALDLSGSMTWDNIAGSLITPREASAAMAMVTARTEKNWHCVGFSCRISTSTWGPIMNDGLTDLNISPKMRLDDVVKVIERTPVGGTDCSLPMQWALQNKVDVDTFVVYTDNETYAGSIHPFQALKQYRNQMGKPNAKLIVVGMVSNGFTIADPNDPGMLDVVGFDTAAPAVMADFSKK